MKSNYSELKIQAEACQYIWNKYPETRYCLYHIANEAQRSYMEWGMLKAAGFVSGIQDLHFLWKGITYRIEMKTENGVISQDQKIIHAAHAKNGSMTYIFRTHRELINFIEGIIKDIDIKYWYYFISPYCQPEKLQQYIDERNKKSK